MNEMEWQWAPTMACDNAECDKKETRSDNARKPDRLNGGYNHLH